MFKSYPWKTKQLLFSSLKLLLQTIFGSMVAKDNASKLKLTSNVSLPVGSSYTILDIETVHSCAYTKHKI